jgi:SAM-dependent methyltransferase
VQSPTAVRVECFALSLGYTPLPARGSDAAICTWGVSMDKYGLRASETDRRPLVSAAKKPSLTEYIEVLAEHRRSEWAWSHYKDVLVDLLRIRNGRRIMEIGGGRFPLFDRSEIAAFDVEYIVNDVNPAELARAPSEVGKVCFDIASADTVEIKELADTVDLTFSKMVFEHVSDARQAYRNIYKLLSRRGVCLNFHPVLFSPPFLINYLVPAAPAERLLRKISPRRNYDEQPKFPARYQYCRISSSLQNSLKSIGFRQVWQLPFWFHEYFNRFPGLQQCDQTINKIAERANWTALASYCYTIVVK